MKLSRFEFTPIAIVECILCVILLPIVVLVWKNGYYAMVYKQNFDEALASYNGQRLAVTFQAIERAMEALPEEPYPSLMRGQLLIEQKRVDAAKEHYIEAQGLPDSLAVTIARLGVSVCDLYELEKLPTMIEKERRCGELQTELESILREYREFSDAMIVLGHIYIQKARLSKQKKELSRAEREIKRAEEYFNKVIEGGTKVSLPDRLSSCSLYVGMGIVHYWYAKEALELAPGLSPGSPQAEEIIGHFRQSVEYLRRAWMYRITNENLLDNIQKIYGELLGSAWLTQEQRRKLAEEAEYYFFTELRSYSNHLKRLGEREKLESWGLFDNNREASLRHLFNGVGVARYHLRELDKARDMFARGVQHKPKDADEIYRNLSQLAIHKANVLYQTGDFSTKTKAKSAYQRESRVYQARLNRFGAVPSLTGSKELQKAEVFVDLSNHITLQYYGTYGDSLVETASLLEQMLKSEQLPTQRFYVGAEEDPVTAQQIIRHNLFFFYSKIGDEKKKRLWQKYQLRLKDVK